jgi:hypothetical protein
MYDLYEPLRDELSAHALFSSLRVIWAWMQQLQFGQDFPADIEVPEDIRRVLRTPTRGVYEWELALLAKELIVLAPENGSVDLRSWGRFSSTLNKLKGLDNGISGRYEALFRQHIFIEMYRIAHQQFWWQRALRLDSEVTRYLKIFGAPALDSILQQRLGFSAHVLFTIGLSVSGHFLTEFELSAPLTFDLYGVTGEQIALFFARYCKPLAEMRVLCREAESFDENFIYAFNPLLQFPLVWYPAGGQIRILAPVPRYLIRRFTEGVYYDVLGAPGFDAAFGDAYQAYVGDVLTAVNTSHSLAITPEREYVVGKYKKRSVDWIVSDSTGDLFIECKTKRLRLDAKIALSDQTPLRSELTKLAEFAVQIYKTLIDGLAGRYPHWTPSGKPLYPVIVTLEEWFVFGHKLDGEIDARVRSEFRSHGIDARLLDQFPLTICSVGEFERLMALVAMKGAHAVMAEKVTPKRKLWLLHSVLLDAFPKDFPSTRVNLFPEALASITGEAP